jgi:N-acetylmuramic acid 6-phosphate etherase
MISTATMIRLGKVKDNKMVDMTPSNNKLIDRGIKMIMEQSHLNYEEAKLLLEKHGNVRKSLDNLIQ